MILGGYIYQIHTEKRDLYLKKEHKGIIPGGAMVIGGVCSMYFQHYIRLISLVEKGRDYRAETRQGEHPQEENAPFPLMSKGER
jgi:hypothetical protein